MRQLSLKLPWRCDLKPSLPHSGWSYIEDHFCFLGGNFLFFGNDTFMFLNHT